MQTPRALQHLDSTLDRFFRSAVRPRPGDGVVVGFSGGPDSTALLIGLARLAAPGGPLADLAVVAAHLDHGLDPGSAERARHAARVAETLGVPAVVERRPVGALARPGESLETAGRRVRYAFLEEVRLAEGGRWIAVAHHRDDQAETVVLRLLFGTGIEGLAAMRPVREPIVRPLLALGRSTLARALAEAAADAPSNAPSGVGPRAAITPVDDPTNRHPGHARNRVRHALLPALAREAGSEREPGSEQGAEALTARLVRLAEAAARTRDRLGETFERLLEPEPLDRAGRGVAIRTGALAALPRALFPHALAFLHRRAGAPYPATAAARAELARQIGGALEAGTAAPERTRIGCDCGGGWRWEEAGERLELSGPAERAQPTAPRDFSYTLTIPGTVDVPELGLSVRVRREAVAPWMFRGSRRRAALALPVGPGARLIVRRRRPGDRIRPLGAPGTRKLKDLLIDRRIPRDRRDRLPLLCLGDRIAWVPGVTVDEAFRIAPGTERAWVAEVMP